MSDIHLYYSEHRLHKVYLLRWTNNMAYIGMTGADYVEKYLGLRRTGSPSVLKEALRGHGMPTIDILYASTDREQARRAEKKLIAFHSKQWGNALINKQERKGH